MFDLRDMPGFRRIEPADVPSPFLVHHIENLERIRKRRAEEQQHIDAACYDRMGQRRNELRKAMLVNLVV